MKFMRRILIFGLLSLLGACTSTQRTTFYLLTTIETTRLDSLQDKSCFDGMAVLVKRAKFPEYLDRPQMVVRENQYKLQFTEQHRWAEPLKHDFTRVFVDNLDNRIAPGVARIYSDLDDPNPNYQLSIEVLQMDVNMNDQAVLRADWSITTGKNAKLIKRQNSEISLAVDNKSYESGVEAQSKAIAQLADQIAETLFALQKTYDNN